MRDLTLIRPAGAINKDTDARPLIGRENRNIRFGGLPVLSKSGGAYVCISSPALPGMHRDNRCRKRTRSSAQRAHPVKIDELAVDDNRNGQRCVFTEIARQFFL